MKTVSVKLNKKMVVCTANHLFLTQRGWVRADKLCQTDVIENS